MGLAKQSSRPIAIDGVNYRWAVSPDIGYMWLVIELADGAGQRIEASFDYHDVVGPDGHLGGQRRTIAPGVVRAMVLYALANGWRPAQGGLKPMRIDGESVRPLSAAQF